MTTQEERKKIRTSRIKLVLIISFFVGPLLAATVWYYGFDAKYAPTGQSNHAPLIEPVYQIKPFSNFIAGGSNSKFSSLNKKWTIVHIVDGLCDEVCQLSLYNTRQTRVAVGRESFRIERIIIFSDTDRNINLIQEHRDAVILKAGDNGLESQIQNLIKREGLGKSDAILFDPLGNGMMQIPVDLEPKLLLKDLKKLLKLSRIG